MSPDKIKEKTVKIPYDVFLAMFRLCFKIDLHDTLNADVSLKKDVIDEYNIVMPFIVDKVNRLASRELYSKYKSADSESARKQAYLIYIESLKNSN